MFILPLIPLSHTDLQANLSTPHYEVSVQTLSESRRLLGRTDPRFDDYVFAREPSEAMLQSSVSKESLSETQSNTEKAIDASEFAQIEKSLKHEFVQRHPYPYAEQGFNLLAQAAKRSKAKYKIVPIYNPDDYFDISVSYILAGQLGKLDSPPKQLEKSLWKRHSAEIFSLLPFGDSLSRAAGKIPMGSGIDEDAQDKLAIQNLENFKVIIATYLGSSEAGEFQAAAPLKQVQIFSRAFQEFSKNLDFPCPWSVFLIDIDDQDSAHGYSGVELGPLSGELVRLNGGDFSSLRGINKLNRQEKTQKLKSAFTAAIARGHVAAEQATPQAAALLAASLWSRLDESQSGWLLHGADLITTGDKDMVLRFFGRDKLKQFNTFPTDSLERRDMRVAASILCLMFDAAGGFLIE